MIDTNEDKANDIYEGLAKELEPLLGLELAEKLIHDEGVVVNGLNDSRHHHIANLPI